MIPKWLVSIRGQVPRWAAISLGLIPILAIFILWWALTRGEVVEERVISSNILPSPGEVFSPSTLGQLVGMDKDKGQRQLIVHIGISLRRIALGYLLAMVIVLPLGILMGSIGSVRAMFGPSATASGYIPIATLVPLTMLWFGIGEGQKVVFLAMAFGIYLLPLVVRAIAQVPDVYLRTSYTLGASRISAVLRVLVPIALPEIWHAMRLAFGVGWTYLVLTEVVVRDGGLGDLVEISRRRGPREHIYLVIMVITIIAWIADLGWVNLGRLLFPYRRTAK